MRVPRGLLARLASLLVLMLFAAACGNDPADTADEETAAVDTPAEDTAAPADEPTTEAAAPTEPTAEAPTTEATTEAAAAPTDAADTGTDDTAAAASLDDLCAESEGVEVPEDFNVGLVTDIGTVTDGTFNQFANDGMVAAADCFGVETTVIETASEADYAQNLEAILAEEPEVVVTVGFLIAEATLAAAEANPDIFYVGIDQFQETYPDNYVGVLFREDQGGYLAGTMAGLLTESNVVGVVGGLESVPPVVRLVNGFEQGALAIDPDITVLSVYLDSFVDPAAGASTAEQFLGEGADVIFGAGGLTGSGGVTAATQAGAWGIGVDQDEYFTTYSGGTTPGAEMLATSAVKRVDIGVFSQIAAALNDEFADGVFILEAANGGITYAPFHDADIPEDVAAQLEEVRAGLADGSIDTGVDPVTGLPLEE